MSRVVTCSLSPMVQAFLDFAERMAREERAQWPHQEARATRGARQRAGGVDKTAAEGDLEGFVVPDPPLPLLCAPGRLLRYSCMPSLRGAPATKKSLVIPDGVT